MSIRESTENTGRDEVLDILADIERMTAADADTEVDSAAGDIAEAEHGDIVENNAEAQPDTATEDNEDSQRDAATEDNEDSLQDTEFDEDAELEAAEGADGVKGKARMELYDWMQCIVTAIICGILIFVFIGRTIGVEGNSMLDTLHWNDRVIMSGLFYSPKGGDIIIFRPPTDAFGSTPLVKRVVAVAGQTVDINFTTGVLYIDGEEIKEGDRRYIEEPIVTRLNFNGPVTVPEGHVFVLGDNRNRSSDSRDSRIGMVDTRYILGRVLFLLIPGQDERTPRDWSRVGFVS